MFCGTRPERKTQEHVLPQWLIELSGDPKRTARFEGPDGWKEFSFDSFRFPACDTCNNAYGALEAKAKPVLLRLTRSKGITHVDASVLLDWFDKLRIAVWLGALMILGNPFGITPKFHVHTRSGIRDRVVYLGWCCQPSRRLSFFSYRDPVFQHVPSFFGLYVNGLAFANASFTGCLGSALGLPYATPTEQWVGFGKDEVNLVWPRQLGQVAELPVQSKGFNALAQLVWPAALLDSASLRRIRRWLAPAENPDDVRRSRIWLLRGRHARCLTRGPTRVLPTPFGDGDLTLRKLAKLVAKLRRHVVRRVNLPPDGLYKRVMQALKILGEMGLPGAPLLPMRDVKRLRTRLCGLGPPAEALAMYEGTEGNEVL